MNIEVSNESTKTGMAGGIAAKTSGTVSPKRLLIGAVG
jgi:hypothetical protein